MKDGDKNSQIITSIRGFASISSFRIHKCTLAPKFAAKKCDWLVRAVASAAQSDLPKQHTHTHSHTTALSHAQTARQCALAKGRGRTQRERAQRQKRANEQLMRSLIIITLHMRSCAKVEVIKSSELASELFGPLLTITRRRDFRLAPSTNLKPNWKRDHEAMKRSHGPFSNWPLF